MVLLGWGWRDVSAGKHLGPQIWVQAEQRRTHANAGRCSGGTRFIAARFNADALSNSWALSPFRRVGYNDMTYILPGGTGANALRGETWTPWLTKCTIRMSLHTQAHTHAHTNMCALTHTHEIFPFWNYEGSHPCATLETHLFPFISDGQTTGVEL